MTSIKRSPDPAEQRSCWINTGKKESDHTENKTSGAAAPTGAAVFSEIDNAAKIGYI